MHEALSFVPNMCSCFYFLFCVILFFFLFLFLSIPPFLLLFLIVIHKFLMWIKLVRIRCNSLLFSLYA